MLSKKRLTFDYAVNDKYSFSLLDKQGQKLNINADDIFYIAADVNFDLTDTPCFYSTDFYLMVYLLLLKTNQHRRYFKEKCFCVSFSHLLRWDSLCMDIRE